MATECKVRPLRIGFVAPTHGRVDKAPSPRLMALAERMRELRREAEDPSAATILLPVDEYEAAYEDMEAWERHHHPGRGVAICTDLLDREHFLIQGRPVFMGA